MLSRRLRRGRLLAPGIGAMVALLSIAVIAKMARVPDTEDVEARGDFTFQDGDLVFQSCPGALCRVIEGVTESPLSHVGMVQGQGVKRTVIEAYAPVGEVPLDEFLARSRGAVVVLRFGPQLANHVDAIQAEMRTFYGRPYDARYRWDDEAIYCTELVHKAVLRVTGVELAPRVRLGDLRYQPYEAYIQGREGRLPLQRRLSTPAGMRRSRHLRLIYSGIDDA